MEHQLMVMIFCCLWEVCIVQISGPTIASSKFATNNPTLTTIALEKPFCVFDGSMKKGASYQVHLYVILGHSVSPSVTVTDNSSKPLATTFRQTNGGQNGPYRAAVFDVPHCATPPELSDATDPTDAPPVLTQYLVRVGNDSLCLNDPNFQDVCNPPLFKDTTYRFKYILVDRAVGIVEDQTLWSQPIKTKMLKHSTAIDTLPEKRSGGMITIASILSMLMFLLVAGFMVAIFRPVKELEDTLTETRYESQAMQQVPPRLQEISGPSLSPNL